MYVRLRAASTKPSVCLLCTFPLPSKLPITTGARRHTTRAQTVQLPPPNHRHDALPASSSFTVSSALSYGKHPHALDDSLEPARKRKIAADSEIKSTRQAFKEAQETERRRKALATLDKTTKFIAAGLIDSHEPTLADLDHFKPKGPPPITLDFVYPGPTSPSYLGSPTLSAVERYRKSFEKHVAILASKFRRNQLLRLYKVGMQTGTVMHPGTPRKKGTLKTTRDVAGEVVRWLWHWPYVTEVEERVAYMTSRSERVFLISISEFFLLLGPDGSSLRALTENYGVVIKSVKRTDDAFTLVVEGLSYMLDELNLVLAEHKKRIITELICLKVSDKVSSETSTSTASSSILPDLTQRISKLTNALVEDMGNGMFQISAHNTRNIAMSRRLVIRASQQNELPIPPVLAHLPTSKDSTPEHITPQPYALFPFEVTSPNNLPFYWTPTKLSTRSSESAVTNLKNPPLASSPFLHHSFRSPYIYRVRKVCDWLGQLHNGAAGPSGLRDGIGRIIDSLGQPQSLRKALGLPDMDCMENPQVQQVTITARLGHFVFAPAAGLKSLLPPLRGSWSFSKFFDWMRVDTGRMTFISEPPNPLINSSPLNQTTLSRLVYRSSTLSMTLPDEKLEDVASPTTSITLKFEVPLLQSTWREGDSSSAVGSVQEDPFDASTQTMYNEQDTVTGPQSLSDQSSTVTQLSQMEPLSSLSREPLPSSGDSVQMWKGVSGSTASLDLEDTFDAPVRMMYNEQYTDSGSQSLSNQYFTDPQPSQADPPSSPPGSPGSSSDEPVRLRRGVETLVNVMLPDRPMDMQLSSFESISIPLGLEPTELREYASGLTHCLKHSDSSSRPIPPLHVTYEGTRYVLDTHATVQASSHVLTDFSTTEQVNVTIENMVDVESNQHSSDCFVACSEPNATSAWYKFLGACDRLTWLRARKEITHSALYPKQESANTGIPNLDDM